MSVEIRPGWGIQDAEFTVTPEPFQVLSFDVHSALGVGNGSRVMSVKALKDSYKEKGYYIGLKDAVSIIDSVAHHKWDEVDDYGTYRCIYCHKYDSPSDGHPGVVHTVFCSERR